MKRLIAVLVAIVACCPAGAVARKIATKAQRRTVLAAVVRQHELSSAQARCQVVTISTVNRRWATVTWPAHLSKACSKVAANGVIIEHFRSKAWRFAFVGSVVPCTAGGMPARVGRDLLRYCQRSEADKQ